MTRIGYKVLFDKDKLRTKLQTGGKDENSGAVTWKPIIIIDELQQSPLQPYEFIYGAYNNNKKLQSIFKQYPTMSGTTIISLLLLSLSSSSSSSSLSSHHQVKSSRLLVS